MLKYKNNRLVFVGKSIKRIQRATKVTAICFCGNEFDTFLNSLKRGSTKSCGCLVGEKHGEYGIRLYRIWAHMKTRCNNKNYIRYSDWGERGIKLCKEWHSYTLFRNWALENGYQENLSIDRINNDGNYEPDNCKWSTTFEQARNTRKTILFKGECAADASERLGGSESLVQMRVYMGWLKERAFNTPLRKKKIC